MNANLPLTHFDRIAAAPDAVPRLRRFILDLAVRGRLVPQDPNDEPASELVKRIAAEKARLVKAGKAAVPSGKLGELEFPTPATWVIARLAEISNIVMGQSPPGETYNAHGEGVPLINGPVEFSEGPFGATVINQYTTAPTNFCHKGDFLICVRGSTTGRSNIAAFDACIGRGVAAIQPLFDDGFVRLFLWSMRERIISMGRGVAFPSITRIQLENLPVPLPPLAEQHRIVAKVDELMALCDRLEAARTARETTRNRLAATSLARLNAPDPDPPAFRKDSAFALHNLTPLTARPDQIKALRQTILNLAVRGKLVPQDPNDELASVLIERARGSMSALIKSGQVVKTKALNPVTRGDELFSVPTGWQWVRLGELSKLITKGSSPKWQGIEYVGEESGVLFITSENVGSYTLAKMDNPKYVEVRFNQIESRSILQKGDILLTLVGASIGRSALFDLERIANINQAVALIRPIQENAHIVSSYLLHYLNSPVCINEMLGARAISAQPNISLTDTRNFLIPLPPLAEQHRIVARVDALMPLCDRLEASLTTGDETRGRLLESVLYGALEMAADGEHGHG